MDFLSNNIIQNKRVILRCDFNVPVKDGYILDDSKIVKSLDTINYLLENNNRIIILSHFGRVKTEEDKQNNSLKVVYDKLQEYIPDLVFIEENRDIEKAVNFSGNKCFLVENTRFTDIPEKRESVNDLTLAKFWASFGDVFVLDAFASMHRVHSSTAGIGMFLPTYVGFLAEKEIKNLELLINNIDRPFVVIMGGAKVDDKIKVIKNIINRCDTLVITGGILNTFLHYQGYDVGDSFISTDPEVVNDVRYLLDNFKSRISYSGSLIKYDNKICDNLINKTFFEKARTVFLNGTCGIYEDENFQKGTKTLFEDLVESHAKVVVGGGDSLSAVKYFNYEDKFYYLSSGGGATLEYVSSGKINALEWIKLNRKY